MPGLIEIAGLSKLAHKRAPLASLRAEVKISPVSPAQVKRAEKTIRKASLSDAVRATRVALMALATGRFEEAANIAVNAAIMAAASFKANPVVATRIFVTSRGIARNAVRRIMARSV